MDEDRIPASERLQIERIRELDMEELQVEEVGDDDDSSDDGLVVLPSGHGDGGASPFGGFTYNTSLASLHTYLGEVNDTRGRLSFLDGGAIFNLPMFYLEGVVLFPEATLPLRVIQPRFIVAVEKALNNVDAPYTIGVVRVHRSDDGRAHFASTGTTAEIRQYRRQDDGSLNLVARGQQRFRLRRSWLDAEGAPCGEVQIIQEDTPLRMPRDAFGLLVSASKFRKNSYRHAPLTSFSSPKQHEHQYAENESEFMPAGSDHSTIICLSATDSSNSPNTYDRSDESSSGDDEFIYAQQLRKKLPQSKWFSGSHQSCRLGKLVEDNHELNSVDEYSPGKRFDDSKRWKKKLAVNEVKFAFHAPMTVWPLWVYEMYDSYSLAQKAADLWRRVVGNPSMDDFARKPDLLSFYIASKLPMSDATRQELLEIDGISYRLQREIQLLKGFNLIRCKSCQTLIAKRSDMVVMSTDGPLNAYVNPNGFVHEIITVYNTTGLALIGPPVKEHSWFPGYAWTITNCIICESNMGWLFTATKKNLLPKSFWGIRSSQVVDDTPKYG